MVLRCTVIAVNTMAGRLLVMMVVPGGLVGGGEVARPTRIVPVVSVLGIVMVVVVEAIGHR